MPLRNLPTTVVSCSRLTMARSEGRVPEGVFITSGCHRPIAYSLGDQLCVSFLRVRRFAVDWGRLLANTGRLYRLGYPMSNQVL